MTGQPKNENLPEISRADEWFDLDREGKLMENDPNTPPVDDWLPDEDDIRLCCPFCGHDVLLYAGEAYDDLDYMGSSYECGECGHKFTNADASEW